MKFLHLSDLHIGKRVHECSMIEEQKHIFSQVISVIDDRKIEAVLIAGDVYDKAVPSAEAVQLFDSFLTSLAKRNLYVFVISGNHDSAERIAFGSEIMQNMNIHMSPVYDGSIRAVSVNDAYGTINIYMLPYIKPVYVRSIFEDAKIESYNDAVRFAINQMEVNENERNIILSHQFVTGAVTCDSEEMSVGGVENISADVYDCFDYVALGHIHSPQKCTRETLRYCGSPLKYSFSEANHVKTAVIAELSEKGKVNLEFIELKPLHDMREIRDSYSALTSRAIYTGTNTDDFLHITLTDESPIPGAADKLRVIYPNLLLLDYDNLKTGISDSDENSADVENKTPLELLDSFYVMQNGKEMSNFQREYAKKIIEDVWEGQK